MIDMIPIYEVIIKDDWCDGIFGVSLVDTPAVESNFIAFSKEKDMMQFSIENEAEHKIIGCLLRADFPIYRFDGNMGEYYLKFTKDNIEKLAQKLLKDHTFANISLQHDGNLINEVNLQQIYIKNSAKGISPIGFEDIEEGSLFGQFKVNNVDVWEKIQKGEIKGFSVEGMFSLNEVEMKKIEKNNKKDNKDKNMAKKLKEALRKLLAEFGSVETDKGILEYEGEGELKVGDKVFIGENPAEDGEYKVDNKVFVIKDGAVAEIKENEAEKEETEEAKPQASEEQPAKEEMAEEEKPAEVAEEVAEEEVFDAKAEIEALKAEIKEMKKILDEIINKPADEPVAEQFRKATEVEKTGDAKFDKMISRFAALKDC